jgi:hypothetical protein
MNIHTTNYENYSDYRRKIKSISDRILLLDVNYFPLQNFTQCKILGSKNNEYFLNIQIKPNNIERNINLEIIPDDEDDILDIACTCMDFQIRKEPCKHIYWFCKYNLKNHEMNPKLSSPSDLYEFLYYYLYLNKKIKGRNETCPICLEKIDYNIDNYICCIDYCQNAVHNVCWCKYQYISNSNKCVLCRNEID